jgi:hypothetical protein
MQKPNDSLDDFIVRPEDINTQPPRPVELRLTGEVEVLKPLAVWVPPAKAEAAGLSWFHRSLVAGGAFAIVAVVLGSAIFIAMYEGQAEVARVEITSGEQVPEAPRAEEFVSPDGNLLTEELSADVFDNMEPEAPELVRKSSNSVRPSYSKFAIRNSKFKNRKPRITQPTLEPFVPTTLIIYIDKGEVKSRIEPQLTAGYKKTPTLSN